MPLSFAILRANGEAFTRASSFVTDATGAAVAVGAESALGASAVSAFAGADF
ncbi:hypothetical protein D3C81_1368470 [compost metagenome]